MRAQSLRHIVTPALALALAYGAGTSFFSLTARAAGTPAGVAAAAPGGGAPVVAGRYKKDGSKCAWDANDTGPNQCTPQVAGRFKKTGDTCRWDANDNGPDQCRPATGRWKKDGSACNWSASDSGPDQCDPRAPK